MKNISQRSLLISAKPLWNSGILSSGAVELEMGVSRGEESVIQALNPNPTDFTGIHFQGIHVLSILCQV